MGGEPTTFEVHAAWTLVAAYGLSLVYELWRATVRSGATRHDSMRTFLRQDLLLYVIAAAVIWMLLAGVAGAAWVGLVFSSVFVLVSIGYYNPRIMVEREPGLVDWFEDLTYTGLLFVAAALLLYEVTGATLVFDGST